MISPPWLSTLLMLCQYPCDLYIAYDFSCQRFPCHKVTYYFDHYQEAISVLSERVGELERALQFKGTLAAVK